MGDRYAAARSTSLQLAVARRAIKDALEELKRTEPPGKKKPRTKKELDYFLQSVGRLLAAFNVPVPAASILDSEEPPKGPAWAVMVAMVNSDQSFIDFAKEHGQIDTYLAALAISDPESHDHASIACLQQSIASVKKAIVSAKNKENSKKKRQERSPLWSYLRAVIRIDPGLSAKEIFDKTVTGRPCEFEFNDDGGAEITLTEISDGGTDGICFKWEAVARRKRYKKGPIPFKEFEKICSKIRTQMRDGE